MYEDPTQMNLGNSSHSLKKSGPEGHKLHNAIYMKSQKSPKSKFVVARGWGAGEIGKAVLMGSRFLREVTGTLWNQMVVPIIHGKHTKRTRSVGAFHCGESRTLRIASQEKVSKRNDRGLAQKWSFQEACFSGSSSRSLC